MRDCPHCNQKLMYADSQLLHVIRMLTGSHKRHCPGCGRKWIGRSRVHNTGGMFVFILLSSVTTTFGFFHIAELIQQSMQSAQKGITQSIYQEAAEQLGNNPRVQEQLKKFSVDPSQAMAKLKKLRSDPEALAGMSGYKKEMVEKAMQYMDR